MKTNTRYSRKKKKQALKKKSISFTKRKSALLLVTRYMLPKSPISLMVIVTNKCSYDRCDIVMHWVFLSSFIRLLKFAFKQFHGQLFSHSDEVAIPVQCTLGYNLVNPLGICNRTGSNNKKKPYQKENLHRNDKQNLWPGIGKKNMFIQTI